MRDKPKKNDTRRVVVPQIHGWLERFLSLFGSRDPASRSYRYLARQLARDYGHSEGSCKLVFSSPGPVDLTTDALLMTAYFTQQELEASVLLVDATLRDDGVSKRLGFETVPGFVELLAGRQASPLELVRSTSRANISILPAGDVGSTAVPTVGHEKVDSLFSQIDGHFDFVLVQQGSVVNDTRYMPMIPALDGVLLLVEEGATLMEEMDACQNFFRNHGVDNVRLVLAAPR